jgi:hypothetical protein
MITIEMLLLTISYISMFNCIVRSDYNIVISLICYFYWTSRQTKLKRISNIIYLIVLISNIFDIVWLFLVWSKWTASENISLIWQQLWFWHILVITFSLVNILLKSGAILLIYNESKNEHPYNQLKQDLEEKKQTLY